MLNTSLRLTSFLQETPSATFSSLAFMLQYVFRHRQSPSRWWNGLFWCFSPAVLLWSWINATRVRPRICQSLCIILERNQHIAALNRLHCICYIHISGVYSKYKTLQPLFLSEYIVSFKVALPQKVFFSAININLLLLPITNT